MSPIIVVSAGGQAQLLAGRAHHDRAGLADAEGLEAGGRLEHGHDRAAAGPQAVLRRAVRIEVRGDQLGAVEDHPHGRLDHLEVERAAFADDDVIGIVVDDRVAVVVQGLQQAAFADDVGRAVRAAAARKRAVAIAQVKTCSSSTSMPIRCSCVATSRRVRWLLLVRNGKGVSLACNCRDEFGRAGNQFVRRGKSRHPCQSKNREP